MGFCFPSKQKQKYKLKEPNQKIKSDSRIKKNYFVLMEDLSQLKIFNLSQKEKTIKNFSFYYLGGAQYNIVIFNYLLKAIQQFEEIQVVDVLLQFFKVFFADNDIQVYVVENRLLQFRYQNMLARQLKDLENMMKNNSPLKNYSIKQQNVDINRFKKFIDSKNQRKGATH